MGGASHEVLGIKVLEGDILRIVVRKEGKKQIASLSRRNDGMVWVKFENVSAERHLLSIEAVREMFRNYTTSKASDLI